MKMKQKDLLNFLSEENYIRASDITKHYRISTKTARNRINSLRQELKDYGADIVSKPHYGYKLVVSDRTAFERIYSIFESAIPEDSEDREDFILHYLLEHNDYVKIEELADLLYINRNSVSASIKNIETLIHGYNLSIDKKPNYGIILEGSEFNKRRLICSYLKSGETNNKRYYENQDDQLVALGEIVQPLLAKYELYLSEIAYQNYIEFLFVQIERIKQGYTVDGEPKTNVLDSGIKEITYSNDLIKELEKKYGIHYSLREKSYVQLYTAGKRAVGDINNKESNFIIKESIDRLAMQIIDMIYDRFQVDMRSNFDIRMGLNQHIVPFEIRVKFNIPIVNPLLDEIKLKYAFAYRIACYIAPVLEEYYHKAISEDEIGYFALIFQLAIEQEKTPKKRSILIICSTGKSSSRLLTYKYKHEFGKYLNQIYITDVIGMHDFDYSKVDYVFSTVPVDVEIDKPIMIISNFLDSKDIFNIRRALESEEETVIRYYYRRNRMVTNLAAENKEDALQKICEYVCQKEDIDEAVYQSILAREAVESTDYGNGVAIPHPQSVYSEESIVYVFVLEHPIFWKRNMIQLIILTIIGENIEESIQMFYKTTSKFVLNKTAVDELIAQPSYTKLIELLVKE